MFSFDWQLYKEQLSPSIALTVIAIAIVIPLSYAAAAAVYRFIGGRAAIGAPRRNLRSSLILTTAALCLWVSHLAVVSRAYSVCANCESTEPTTFTINLYYDNVSSHLPDCVARIQHGVAIPAAICSAIALFLLYIPTSRIAGRAGAVPGLTMSQQMVQLGVMGPQQPYFGAVPSPSRGQWLAAQPVYATPKGGYEPSRVTSPQSQSVGGAGGYDPSRMGGPSNGAYRSPSAGGGYDPSRVGGGPGMSGQPPYRSSPPAPGGGYDPSRRDPSSGAFRY